ncbi:MAG: hypothetical protein BWZ07_02967 [Alphaproteobacteria bacterium ADurb.BinA280]|nr:MAG: hypothetical protein BWZ07_02967 [Alphaproteobacteria bacterium ADurb.BinA280]
MLRLQGQTQQFQFVAYFNIGPVHVGAPGKLQNDVALTGARDRTQLAQVFHHANRFLNRLGDQALYL